MTFNLEHGIHGILRYVYRLKIRRKNLMNNVVMFYDVASFGDVSEQETDEIRYLFTLL